VNELYTRALMPGWLTCTSARKRLPWGLRGAEEYGLRHQHAPRPWTLPGEGCDADRMFAELLGKEAGYCRGKGGSMHIADPATGILAPTRSWRKRGIATGAAVDRENA